MLDISTLSPFDLLPFIAVGFAATVVLGIMPGPVLDLAAQAGSFVR